MANLLERAKKIEGVRFWNGACNDKWEDFLCTPDYILIKDERCGEDIWVNVEFFNAGLREFGYCEIPDDEELVELTPDQARRVSAYLGEYETFLKDYRSFAKYLSLAETWKKRMERECPTFCERHAQLIEKKLNGICANKDA